MKEPQITFNVVYPYQAGEGKNEDSLSLLFRLANKNWLFTGDLGQDGESEVIIDSLKEEAYLNSEYKNRNMNGVFPILDPGNNIITWTGNLTKIKIQPKSRWL